MMRKSMIIVLLMIQIVLLFLFTNINSLIDEVIRKEEKKVEYRMKISGQSMEVIKTINSIFDYLIVILAIFILITGGFLIYALSSKKKTVESPEIPQLQNYLFQLKDSEIQLKSLVEKQQKKVVSSDELSRNIINSMDVAVILLTGGNKIEIFNKTAERVFDKTFALAKNNRFDDLFAAYPEIVTFVNSKGDPEKRTSELRSRQRYFKIELQPIENTGNLVVIDDLTEQKKREAIIQKNRNFIMLGEMAAFLVHEVRNSLGVIYGYTRTVDNAVPKIDKVNREIVFITEMMERFLNFSKPLKDEKKVEVELNEMISRIGETYGLRVIHRNDPLYVKSDAIQLETVFSNLSRNAAEADATKLEVTYQEEPLTTIWLADNGRGIPDDDRERIWFPFFTTRKKGTGMGLALVKKSLHYLNGDITLERSDSGGSQFKIEFYSN